MIRNLLLLQSAVLVVASCAPVTSIQHNTKEYNIPVDSIRIRDPFIHFDKKRDLYFMPATNRHKGFKMYISPDLKNWKDIGPVFTPDKNFWGKTDFWAPDLYYYNGRYYIFYTCSAENGIRSVGILVSDTPDGQYIPLKNEPITPKDWMALDGALYVDEAGDPWHIYSHEWLQVGDGKVVVQRLSKDLKSVAGEPITIFQASEAPWNIEMTWQKSGRVTDAAFPMFINGKLYMIWSSWTMQEKPNYTIGVAESTTNKITGPWKQHPDPITFDDGGHGMFFKSREGKLMISYHAPNAGPERAIIRPIVIENGTLRIIK